MSKHNKNRSQPRHGGAPAVDAIDRDAERAERMVDDARVEVDNRRERGHEKTDRKAKGRNERRR